MATDMLREALASLGIGSGPVRLKGPITLLTSKPSKRRAWTPAQRKAAPARMKAWHAAKKKAKK